MAASLFVYSNFAERVTKSLTKGYRNHTIKIDYFKEVIVNVFRHLKSYKWQISAVIFLTLVGILLELLLPTLMANVVDIGIVKGDISYIIKIGLLMIVAALIAVLITVGVSYFASQTAQGFGRDVRRRVEM